MEIKYYEGQRGALRFIADITDDYDNAKDIDSLKELIDEVRGEAIRALRLGDEYNAT